MSLPALLARTRSAHPSPRRLVLAAVALWAVLPGSVTTAWAQNAQHVRLLATDNPYPSQGYNDIWGYTAPDGREYAILGTQSGTVFYNVTDPTNPQEVAFIDGANSVWRDMKTYGTFCYAVSDLFPSGQSGLQVINLTDPDNPFLAGTLQGAVETAHNLFIDTDTGLAYVVGGSSGVGATVLDLTFDPVTPLVVGSFNTDYIHDIYVKNNIAYVAYVYTGFAAIYDVTNPAAWILIDQWTYPGSVTHNTWANADQTILVTTDETSGGHLNVWDVSNPGSHPLFDDYQTGSGASIHNAFIRGDRCLMSYYTEGFRVVSLANPTNVVELGFYDMHPDGGLYAGNWGIYPFVTDPTIVYASDMEDGLFVLQMIGGLEGTVTDVTTGLPIEGATVEVVGSSESTLTDPDGLYTLGVPEGSHTIQVSAAGYSPETAPVLINLFETTPLDAQLTPLATGTPGDEAVPGATLALHGNFPNPFHPRTTIRFRLPVAAPVTLTIYDAAGRLVHTFRDGGLGAGTHAIDWDSNAGGRQLPSGVYFYRLEAGDQIVTSRMVLDR